MSDKVVSLAEHRDARIDALWQAYREAAEKAQRSLKLEDGISAGRAWRAWLDLFMTQEQSATIGVLHGRGGARG